MLDSVSLDIVMRSNGFLELGTDDHSWTFRRRTSSEEHDSSSGVGEGGLGSGRGRGRDRSARVEGKRVEEEEKERETSELTSSIPTATLNATPVHLNGLLSFATLHESLWSCSRMLVSWNSHC